MSEGVVDELAERSSSAMIKTLMFTDIEGSTLLLQQLGDHYKALLVRHHEIIRESLNQYHGTEDGTQGDSFLALFDTTAEALDSAVSIQRRLKEEEWPLNVDLRVRIGLHKGIVEEYRGQLVGYDLHLAARVADAANGGQILLSRNAHSALADADLQKWGVVVRDLGPHRLKAIRYPESIFDVVDPQTGDESRPIRTAQTRKTNITQSRGPIIGRDREVAEIQKFLSGGERRLVTLTGMGGTGKTSIAQYVAEQWLLNTEEGTYFVDLGGLDGAALVGSSIAQALGVRDYPGRPVELDIAAFIGDEKMLLVLDTFEHVSAAAVLVGDLLNECPNLRVLATSRSELGVASEKLYPIEPLSLPDPKDITPEDSGAMRLFVEAVQEKTPDFVVTAGNRATVAAIVTRLEGIPLAITLAAARMALLPIEQLHQRLETQLGLLRSSKQDSGRHRTLRTAIRWSDSLLDEEQRDVFLRLSVFVGGFSIETVESTLLRLPGMDADILDAVASLDTQNLIYRRTVNGVPRFGMFDMVREYALDELVRNGEKDETQRVFLEHFKSFAESCGLNALGEDQSAIVSAIVQETDNIRHALTIALELKDIDSVARIIDGLYWYWISQGQFTESLQWIAKANALFEELGSSEAGATIQMAAAYTKAMAGDYPGAYEHGKAAEQIFTELGHEHASKKSGMIHAICGAATGAIDDPTDIVTECIAQMQSKGDNYFTALGLIIMGEGARMENMRDAAEECYLQALDVLAIEKNSFWPGLLKQNLAHFRLSEGKPEDAATLLAEAFDLGQKFDYRIVVNLCVAGFGGLAIAQGDPARAARFLGAVDHNISKIGVDFEPTDKADIATYVDAAKAALGPEKFKEYAEAGATADWIAIQSEARATAGIG